MPRSHFSWQLRSRVLPLGERTLLMGIVNITPDSFSDGGQFFSEEAAVSHALQLFAEGADILDLGAESTRPGATPLTSDEEQARLLPVLRTILELEPEAVVSVDSYHAATADAAIQAGAEIINDVSGLLWDEEMARVLAKHRPGVVLMHTRGRPTEWASLPRLQQDEVLPLVRNGLARTLALADEAGTPRQSIVLDPGFGFGKIGDENFTLLRHMEELQQLGCPLLAGISRKRFLTAHLAKPSAEQRLEATSAANVAAVLAGAHILRVHDVPTARLAAGIADRILRH